MRNIFVAFLFAGGMVSAAFAQQPGSLDFLKQYKDKYAYEAKLFNNTVLKQRLQKMLGAARYRYLTKSIWQTETPVKIENNFFYAWAMQAHSGGDPSATLLADLHTNLLYVEIKKGGIITTYAEDGSKAVPNALKDWEKLQVSK